jgi:hypothetical protein
MNFRFSDIKQSTTVRRSKFKIKDAVGPYEVKQEINGVWIHIQARSRLYTVLHTEDAGKIGAWIIRRYGDCPSPTPKKLELPIRRVSIEEIVIHGAIRWVQLTAVNSTPTLLTPDEAMIIGAQWFGDYGIKKPMRPIKTIKFPGKNAAERN